ncbi:MAG TPA: hypothetical protein VKG45_08845 [Actinomycetes bacterium]|nr:hypothetical protein [Actinomycetes bacterium]
MSHRPGPARGPDRPTPPLRSGRPPRLRLRWRPWIHPERGSQTMEYALLLIVAATIAVLALSWARQGAIKDLLDAVLDKVQDLFGIG